MGKRYLIFSGCMVSILLLLSACYGEQREPLLVTERESIRSSVSVPPSKEREQTTPGSITTTAQARSVGGSSHRSVPHSPSSSAATQASAAIDSGLYHTFTQRGIPSDAPPEIAGNQAFLMSILPYQEEEAARVAQTLYQVGVPEIHRADEVRETSYGYFVQLVDINNVTYHMTLREGDSLSAVVKLGEAGEKIMLYNEMRLYE